MGIIVALDVDDVTEAAQLVAQLGQAADFYKVGLQLLTAEGPSFVRQLVAADKQVFLDLKHVTPGIQGPGDTRNDQARIATVEDAVRAGETHLVVGRSITQAPSPVVTLPPFATKSWQRWHPRRAPLPQAPSHRPAC